MAKLWPRYSVSITHDGVPYCVEVAVGDAEISAARRLLARSHPQRDARHGMLICLYELDEEGSRSLAGVAQIGEYFHTHFRGRAVFGRPMLGAGYAAMGLGDVVKSIPIAAAKRFAIRARRQGRGLGDILARHALIVARNYRWPPARVVEVSRRMSARKLHAACCGRAEDFLSRSGYVPVPLSAWLRDGVLNQGIAIELTDRTVPGYYYADLSDAPRPESIRRAIEKGS
ncbi:MAG TPA: hypothetical protein VF535_02670 [Allosphingosinicella sp.]|jgi:GNAT superfamily N-acetyltransferase